ncbi:nSTAND1 domain-containing NTPase [Paracoccus zhejiangensis]|nr:TIR domain-containing protein [Paracoccus zhejiangensis]
MSTLFLSHSSADNTLAQDLAARLRAQGHTCVFLDLDPEKGIVAGISWERTLYRKLRACRAVIAICTDSYLASHWCFAEIALARMEGKQIIALVADPISDPGRLPSILTERQFIDLRRDPETGYQRLWRGLKELDLLGAVGDWDPTASPYLGLNAYQEKDAPVYFGREDEIRGAIELVDRGAPGLILVIGASGSGKSSLARAGLIPRLRREPERWIVLDPFRPGRDPFAELAQVIGQGFRRYAPDAPPALHEAGTLGDRLRDWQEVSKQRRSAEPAQVGATPVDPSRLGRLISELEALKRQEPASREASLLEFLDWSLTDLRRIFGRHPAPGHGGSAATPLLDLIADLRRSAGHTTARVLLVIDQFEELLGTDSPEGEAARFLGLIAASLAAEGSPLTVVATMRSDFLESFQTVNAHHGMDFATLSLGPMPVEGMRRVIEAPAKLGAIELEAGLADRLLADASSADALPLLSFTLYLLWRDGHQAGRLTLADYDRLGGLEGAVANEADAILATARQRGQEPELRAAFLEMVRLAEDGQFTRQPLALDEPELVPVQDLIDRFIERRLLISRAEGDQRVVEVAHEALFRAWAPLAQWLEDHRSELQLKQQIRHSAAAWEEHRHQPDYLWRGARLSEAVELVGRGGLEGNSKEERRCKAFVLASESMRKRQGRRRRNLVLTVAALLLGFLGYALKNEDEAKSAERASWAREQALRAIGTLATEPLASIRTAEAAICMTQIHDGQVLPEAEGALNRAVNALEKQRSLTGHSRAVSRLIFLPEAGGGQPATTERLVSLGLDHAALLWTLPGSGAPKCSGVLPEEPLLPRASQIAGDPGSRLIAAGLPGGGVTLQAIPASGPPPAPVAVLQLSAEVSALAIAPGGSRIAAAGEDGSLRIGGLTASGVPTQPMALPDRPARIDVLGFSGDGAVLAAGSWDGSVTLWDSGSGLMLRRLDGHAEAVTELAFNGDLLATAGWDQVVRLWNWRTGRLLQVLPHEGRVSALRFLPGEGEAANLASASWDRTVRIWDVTNGQLLKTLEHGAPVVSLAITPEARSRLGHQTGGPLIATGDWDGRVSAWNVELGPGAPVSSRIVAQHLEPVNDLSFTGDGRFLASASDDETIKVTRLFEDEGQYLWRSSLDLSPPTGGSDQARWIAMIQNGEVRVLDPEAQARPRTITDFDGNATGIAFRSDGPQVLAIRANELFDYHLDPTELMVCADRIAQPALPQPPENPDLGNLCAGIETDQGFTSLWSQATAPIAGLVRAITGR